MEIQFGEEDKVLRISALMNELIKNKICDVLTK